MMNSEMMTKIFSDYCEKYGKEWYEVFDSDLFLSVLTEIADRAGIAYTTEDDPIDLLWDKIPDFGEWYNTMAMDL